jgi:hypothetical protein
MPTRLRLALVLIALGCYVVGGIALLALGFWSSLAGEQRDVVGDALRGQAGFLVVAGALHALVLGVVVAAFFGRYRHRYAPGRGRHADRCRREPRSPARPVRATGDP